MGNHKYDTLHTIASLSHNTGGTAAAVSGLCKALALLSGQRPRLLSQAQEKRSCIDLASDHGTYATLSNVRRGRHYGFPHPGPLPEGDRERARLDFLIDAAYQEEIARSRSRLAFRFGWEFRALLAKLVRHQRPRIIHDNGLWLPVNHYVARAARRSGIPLIVNPHLLSLVQAWARLGRRDWKLQIVGPDEAGHLPAVLGLVRASGLEDSVSYLGAIGDAEKKDLFASADLLVLPSFAESFGLVVVEALAHGVPVITTCGTPWWGLVEHQCGWWVEPTEEALAEALTSALELDVSVLRDMGARGREYAREFGWKAVAEKTAEVYRWVLGEGPRPGCVLTD